MEKFGIYLHKLRKQKGLTLKQVERAARVSNAYISQVERGIRNPPHPDILNRLAITYGVPARELLIAAGYIKEETQEKLLKEEIEKAYQHVLTDPHYNQGTRLKGINVPFEVKRFIVEMYEKTTNRKLLAEA